MGLETYPGVKPGQEREKGSKKPDFGRPSIMNVPLIFKALSIQIFFALDLRTTDKL